GEMRQARINSTRTVGVADDERGLWTADLRSRAWLPKHLARGCDSRPLIGSATALKRFRHRLGGRYWRDAVPDDLREAFSAPMSKAFRKGAKNGLLRHFSMLLGRRVEDQVLVLAVIGPNSDEDAAVRDWEQAMHELTRADGTARAMVHPESGPITEQELSV